MALPLDGERFAVSRTAAHFGDFTPGGVEEIIKTFGGEIQERITDDDLIGMAFTWVTGPVRKAPENPLYPDLEISITQLIDRIRLWYKERLLANKVFLVTGSFEHMTLGEVRAAFYGFGARLTSEVGPNVTAVFTGHTYNNRIVTEARAQGIPVYFEGDMLDLLKECDNDACSDVHWLLHHHDKSTGRKIRKVRRVAHHA